MNHSPFLKTLFEHAISEGSRSTALKPLGWLVAMLASTTLAAFYWTTPRWIGTIFAIFTIITVITYLGSYLYFLIKDPDALRSERYSLQKLAIEKGLYGDNLIGRITLDDIRKPQPLAADSSETKELGQ